jgi:hypothetical protein
MVCFKAIIFVCVRKSISIQLVRDLASAVQETSLSKIFNPKIQVPVLRQDVFLVVHAGVTDVLFLTAVQIDLLPLHVLGKTPCSTPLVLSVDAL